MFARTGEMTAPCGVPRSTVSKRPSSSTPAFSHFADQAQQPPVRDTVFEETDEPFPVHRIEERLDVRIQYPVHFLPIDRRRERIQRVMLAALRPESIYEKPMKSVS